MPFMSPGTYLAKRRHAAGLELEDVALRVETTPHLNLRDRVDWLRRIEADISPITIVNASALLCVFPFSGSVLVQLSALRDVQDAVTVGPRLCRECACSELDACEPACWWVEQDLCSTCSFALEHAA